MCVDYTISRLGSGRVVRGFGKHGCKHDCKEDVANLSGDSPGKQVEKIMSSFMRFVVWCCMVRRHVIVQGSSPGSEVSDLTEPDSKFFVVHMQRAICG